MSASSPAVDLTPSDPSETPTVLPDLLPHPLRWNREHVKEFLRANQEEHQKNFRLRCVHGVHTTPICKTPRYVKISFLQRTQRNADIHNSRLSRTL